MSDLGTPASPATRSPIETRFRDAMFSYAPTPLRVLVRGEGARVWDDQGVEYLDFLAGIAVNSLGHAHPAFVDAVSRQAGTIAHVSNYFASEPQLELAERLKRLTGGDAVFFGNSGTEVIEAAIKVSRRTGRQRILTLEKSFHGRSTGALAITGKPAMRAPFEPLLPGPEFLPSTIEALEAAIGDDVAALVVEPIKGEAGVLDLPEGYLAAARELTARHGALLILDEIQTGAGRTGDWFAFQRDLGPGTTPDLVALAKGIGGGFPIGALVAFGAAKDLLQPGDHGTTFGGNPLAMRAGVETLKIVEQDGLLANAAEIGAMLNAGLRRELEGVAGVVEVRGQGLMLGIELDRPCAPLLGRAADAGLLVSVTAERVVRLLPALVLHRDEAEQIVAILCPLIKEFLREPPA
jgi:acetylornithine aminotransferase